MRKSAFGTKRTYRGKDSLVGFWSKADIPMSGGSVPIRRG